MNRCSNCFAETQDYPCSHCGYDPSKEENLSYALTSSILGGRYLIGRMLGQGGFGITYVGWDLALEMKVAIKEFYPSGHVNRYAGMGSCLVWNNGTQAIQFRENGMKSFLKEARKMAKVSNIKEVVGVRDIIQDNETAYIVMDFIEGETLKARLLRNGPMSWEQAKNIFLPAIGAMAQVHKMEMIHRDISPDNLMLEPTGMVRILDLGAAKDLSVNNGASSMQVAKAGFSPVEQYGQQSNSGPWTDVYAMAATIYYTLTGVLPPLAVDRLDQDELNWEHPKLASVPKGVIEALRKAMIVSPRSRTQSMEELLAALENTKEPGKKRKPAPQPKPEKPKKEKPAPQPKPEKPKKEKPAPQPKPEKPVPQPKPEKPKKEKPAPRPKGEMKAKLKKLIPVLLAVIVICVAVVLFKSVSECKFGHSWKSATCTEVQTCKRCGETTGTVLKHEWGLASCAEAAACKLCGKSNGTALGHDWNPASCEAAETCSRCGATQGEALGHNWAEATYTAPKTCIRCGKKEGDPLEQPVAEETKPEEMETVEIPETEETVPEETQKPESPSEESEFVPAYMQEEEVRVSLASVSPLVLYDPIENCTSLTLHFELTEATGWYQGNWRLCLRNEYGKWQDVGSFVVEPDSVGIKCQFDFVFDHPITFDAVAVFPANRVKCSWGNDLAISNVTVD